MSSLAGRATAFLLRELIWEIIRFPVWWYTEGLKLAWHRLERQWMSGVDRTGIRFLLINMGRPMYGDYTRSGRVISFFFRLVLVFWALIGMTFWTIAVLAIFAVWITAPILAAAMLVRQIVAV
jgi:hypothetical protein